MALRQIVKVGCNLFKSTVLSCSFELLGGSSANVSV